MFDYEDENFCGDPDCTLCYPDEWDDGISLFPMTYQEDYTPYVYYDEYEDLDWGYDELDREDY